MIIVDKDACIHCGKCKQNCFHECLDASREVPVEYAKCVECGQCIAVCPVGAIHLENDEYDCTNMNEYGLRSENLPQIDSDLLRRFVKARRSVRQFKQNRPVEKEKIEKMIDAARYVGTAHNSQAFHFVVVQDKMDEFMALAEKCMREDNEKALAEGKRVFQIESEIFKNRISWGAPAFIVVAMSRYTEGGIWEGGMATQILELEGFSQGLGMLMSGCICNLVRDHEELAEWLGIKGLKLVSANLIGYPDVKFYRDVPRRKPDINWR